MANARDESVKREDSEDSLISYFESTLSIRPSTNDEDISIDHTVNQAVPDETVGSESEGENGEYPAKDITLEESFLIKARRRHSLLTGLATKSQVSCNTSQSPTHQIDSKYNRLLLPDPSIDYPLVKFTKVFGDFLHYNSHIQKESPRFPSENDKTLVLLSPLSTEHVFGRKWVSKSYLSTVFERPQRLLASCIGIGAAITMFPFYFKVVNSTKKGSVFSTAVRRVHGKTWPKKLFELCLDSHEKLQEDELEVPEDWNTGDIYLTPKTITAIEGVIGTIETAVDSMFKSKREYHNLAFVVIRPPGHHSHACLPSGFCLINNAQISIEYAHENYGVEYCAILDIDLHHGDGSQDICWERAGFTGDFGLEEDDEIEGESSRPRNEYGKRFASFPKVGYFSLHDIDSYPTELGYASKENIKNASTCVMGHDLNIWNVHLQEWETEEGFFKQYQTKYVTILNRANQFLKNAKKEHEKLTQNYLQEMVKYKKHLSKPNSPDPVEVPVQPPPFKPLIIISAGFDSLEYENPLMQRHNINVPTSFYSTFTKDAIKLAKIHTSGRVLSFLEGGYSDGALSTGIFSHLIGLNNDENVAWNKTWGSEQVMKELTKGCKTNWTPYKNPKNDVNVWANEAIKLGRALMPNSILPQNYIYKYVDPSEQPWPKTVKSLVGEEETKRNLRHTRTRR